METVNSEDAYALMEQVMKAFTFSAAKIASDPALAAEIKAQHAKLRDGRLSPGKKAK